MSVEKTSRGKVIVFGICFWYPLAGMCFQFLHFLLALRRLGYSPYYVEDSGRWLYDPTSNDLSPDARPNIDAVAPVLEAHGFSGRWAFRGRYPGGQCYGMTEARLGELYREADAFLNVTGGQEIHEEHLAIPRRIYVETDPVASQVKVSQGDEATIQALAQHDVHFSYGENLGAPDCGVPLERFTWLPTRQPVLLELWRQVNGGGGSAYNTVATWKNQGKDIVLGGETFHWSKDREFMKFLDLPRRRPVPFELAAGVDGDARRALLEHGWRLANSLDVSRDLERYRSFIRGARAEFTVAKDQNIRLRSGWFSDRSACYLAAGRPVVTQDTGFGNHLPTGQGLFSFRTTEDVLAAVDAIEADYEGNRNAAFEIAAEYFDAEKVLQSLMDRAGL